MESPFLKPPRFLRSASHMFSWICVFSWFFFNRSTILYQHSSTPFGEDFLLVFQPPRKQIYVFLGGYSTRLTPKTTLRKYYFLMGFFGSILFKLKPVRRDPKISKIVLNTLLKTTMEPENVPVEKVKNI